jgi:hypothetical protein
MMLRGFNIVAFALAVTLAFGLYNVKYRAQYEESRIAALEKTLAEERETIRVLQAEWSYLNAPERLERLTGRFLDLEPVKPEQVVSFEELPIRRPDPALLNLPEPRLGGYAAATPLPGSGGGQMQ